MCVYIYIHHIFFNHSSVDGQLILFYVLTVVTNAMMSMEVQISLQIRDLHWIYSLWRYIYIYISSGRIIG
jgi:hypothetical protein